MFYYLGRKKSLARMYPAPTHGLIVEPFAGSGAYSLHGNNWQSEVVLNDENDMVVEAWRYLQRCNASDILSLPKFSKGDALSDVKSLTPVERWIIAQHINPGSDQQSNIVTAFSRWPAGQRYIASNLHKIKHFKIVHGDYSKSLKYLDRTNATWFIDPPYYGVPYYRTNTVVHSSLADWCMGRHGRVIVCEREGAAWLPFEPLATISICGKSKSKEVAYILDNNQPTES